MNKCTLLLLAAALALPGCADTLMTDGRLKSSIAMVLHVPVASVTILDRQSDGITNNFVAARTPRGDYDCTINGGGLLALGLTNPPQCSPRGVAAR